MSIYDFKINSLSGQTIDFSNFKGKYLLIVNVASKCGFTRQYEDLQKLHELHGDDLAVIGFPCNQFGTQEPGKPQEIQAFCSTNFGVTFPLALKIDVKGKNQHPLYTWLTSKEHNGVKNTSVRWNFQKYLIGKDGRLMEVFYSITGPMNKRITKLIV